MTTPLIGHSLTKRSLAWTVLTIPSTVSIEGSPARTPRTAARKLQTREAQRVNTRPSPWPDATAENQLDPDAEDDDIAMIPAMVALAQIMSEGSHLLYHSPKRSISERPRIAMALDRKLLDWKSYLPKCLNIDAASLNDTEWAFKQKLVLKLHESVFHHIDRHF
ncbi:hypothetical protein ATEIFO6365_0001088100 [Aspergillus terreus]|uniref:Uncharacterized protein n=1 Tax=Aspergillus terreus TaxID=33178 RepID=A0A5M3YR95_ASPTE|nr:hypothetical protein ATETN484_0001080200 [Aspergillus terreus]GFF12657.1 hypothetical protein ATEIFO6365_0001088100 [Aspergillus terreus]